MQQSKVISGSQARAKRAKFASPESETLSGFHFALRIVLEARSRRPMELLKRNDPAFADVVCLRRITHARATETVSAV